MTSWTDLIDTDPVAAAKAHAEEREQYNDVSDENDRLIDNLAALCETLADPAMCHVRGEAKGRMSWAMDMYRNPDGSRRFPEVK